LFFFSDHLLLILLISQLYMYSSIDIGKIESRVACWSEVESS